MTLKNMISRRTFSGLLSAIVVASVIPGIVQARDMTVANNVVLVHGLYADGSSWVDEIPYLQRAGLQVSAVQNPLTSLADDVAATRRVLELQDGPTCGPVPFAVAPRNFSFRDDLALSGSPFPFSTQSGSDGDRAVSLRDAAHRYRSGYCLSFNF